MSTYAPVKPTPVIAALLIAALGLPASGASPEDQPIASAAKSSKAGRDSTHRIIVKFRERIAEASASVAGGRSMRELSDSAGVELTFVRDMATGAKVLGLAKALPLGDVEAIAKKIAREPGVEYAEPDIRMYPLLTPNDPQYANQWHLTDYLGGINAPAAWDIATGSVNTVVAVLDTGRTVHPDLDERLLPGYDFITERRFPKN